MSADKSSDPQPMMHEPSKPFRPTHGDNAGSLKRLVSLPRGPWLASEQFGMRFILSQDNEILWRCDWMPMPMLKAMIDAANKQAKQKSAITPTASVARKCDERISSNS